MSHVDKKETIKSIYDAKVSGRRGLAALRPEAKIERLIELQELAASVAEAAGRQPRQPWSIKRDRPRELEATLAEAPSQLES